MTFYMFPKLIENLSMFNYIIYLVNRIHVCLAQVGTCIRNALVVLVIKMEKEYIDYVIHIITLDTFKV